MAWAQMRVLLDSAERPAAYVRLHYMGSETTRQLAAALRRAEADRCLGVIIDLRNNPGVCHLNPVGFSAEADRCLGVIIDLRKQSRCVSSEPCRL